jgi:ribonuclease HII
MRNPMFQFEERAYRQGGKIVAGVDEAGRGPLAGPVVAAAVVLPRKFSHEILTDSKQLTAQERDELFAFLTDHPLIRYGIGTGSVELIDQINISQATHWAMLEALSQLDPPADHVLIDGLPLPTLSAHHTRIVDGDARSYSIAAASVLAKVTRDRLMERLHAQYPLYNFARHKGYATPEHVDLLVKHGVCPIHRKSFAPIRKERIDPKSL